MLFSQYFLNNEKDGDRLKSEEKVLEMLFLKNALNDIEGLKLYEIAMQHEMYKDELLTIDAIVYYKGKLFCIQNSSYEGKIVLKPNYEQVVVYNKLGPIRIPYIKTTYCGLTTNYIEQQVGGNVQYYRNPIFQLENFIEAFKKYLKIIDEDLVHIPIEGFVCFVSEQADIKEAATYISAFQQPDSLKDTILLSAGQNTVNEKWIEVYLKQLPKKDKLKTNEGIIVEGKLEGMALSISVEGQERQIPYHEIQSISLKHESKNHQRASVILASGESILGELQQDTIGFEDKNGFKTYHLKHLQSITVGTQPLREKGLLIPGIA